MSFDPQAILDHLLGAEPLRVGELRSTSAGLYALYDHELRPAYIGATEDFRDRIFGRHSRGDDNSHKFSTVYNAGRMFHAGKPPRTCPKDGKIAKRLRTLFARRFCGVVTYELPGLSIEQLFPIETAVKEIAPPEAKRWNDRKALEAFEPYELVDQLLQDLNWDQTRLAAIERQAERWEIA